MAQTKKEERCEIVINGMTFRDWETVWVHVKYGMPPNAFRVTVSEGVPLARSFVGQQIKPGDGCDITLSGNKVMTGYVNHRQVAYNSHQHAVMIAGAGVAQDISMSSAYIPGTPGWYKQKTFDTIARKELEKFPKTKLKYQGNRATQYSMLPFSEEQKQPGETVFDFLARLARKRQMYLTEDADGNYVAISDPISSNATLKEGHNILEANCIIQDASIRHPIIMQGQRRSTDKEFAAVTSQMNYTLPVPYLQNLGRWRPYVGIMESPADNNNDLKLRAQYEYQHRDSENIFCEITVYGWEMTPGKPWWPGFNVFVDSPMLMLKQELSIREVTFTQDLRGGTRTKILLNRLGGQMNLDSYL